MNNTDFITKGEIIRHLLKRCQNECVRLTDCSSCEIGKTLDFVSTFPNNIRICFEDSEKETTDRKKIGYWFDVGVSCRCSECGCKNNRETNFCPNCGAKMKRSD